jgi:transcriptional regulator with XRE-family HTH domain
MPRIRQLRYERGLTQADVAQGSSVSARTLTALENGAQPSALVAKRLADFYEVTVGELLDLEAAA